MYVRVLESRLDDLELLPSPKKKSNTTNGGGGGEVWEESIDNEEIRRRGWERRRAGRGNELA